MKRCEAICIRACINISTTTVPSVSFSPAMEDALWECIEGVPRPTCVLGPVSRQKFVSGSTVEFQNRLEEMMSSCFLVSSATYIVYYSLHTYLQINLGPKESLQNQKLEELCFHCDVSFGLPTYRWTWASKKPQPVPKPISKDRLAREGRIEIYRYDMTAYFSTIHDTVNLSLDSKYIKEF